MGESVECGPRQPFAAQYLGPVFNGQIGRHDLNLRPLRTERIGCARSF